MQRESIDDTFALTTVLDVFEDAFDTLDASEYVTAVREAHESSERAGWIDRASSLFSSVAARLF
ncbi:MAG: hypothetical protein HUU15_16910 [Candidatus Brocadiae bacterium]|nr:hypothetical protein [Candidatus Brocadiia bacterium]